MTTLYIDRKNVRLDLDAEALVFYENGERIGTVPLGPLQRIVIRGGVTVDTSLLGKLGANGIGVIFISGRKAEPTLFMPRAHNDAVRRLAQYRAACDPQRALAIAGKIVADKLAAQRTYLQSKVENRLDCRYELTRVIKAISGMMGQIDDKPSLAELRGLEGAAANMYFTAYAALAPESLGFHGRNRRPPKDPLNATLSLAYTLLHAEATLAAHAAGLDPCIGFLHAPAFGRESLASDLIEALRADVDAWAMALFNRQELRAESFSNTADGCFLGKAGREKFYRAWEPLAENLRKKMEHQARTLLRLIAADGTENDGANEE